MNDEARILSDEAREKMEAAPFVDQFARKCEQHIAAGNLAAARTDLEKARALDAGHPALARVQKMLADKEAAPAAFDASSFVVDTPAAPAGRGTAQASDFGFTFEEEKTPSTQSKSDGFANFSFDTPAAPAQAPASAPSQSSSGGFTSFSFDTPIASPAAVPDAPKSSGDFDFSTASIETSPDDQKKIDQYLADGDRAFENSDYQQAIDLWSRIFLIDVTNEAASDRIEKAKLKRREIDQKTEAILASGVQALERGDSTTARAKFNEVLTLDPNNPSARDYMQRIDEGAGSAAVPPPTPYKPVLDEESMDFPDIAYPPEPAAAPAKGARAAAAAAAEPRRAASGRKLPVAAIAAVVGLLVLAAGGWFVWNRFLSSSEADPVATRGTIERASNLGQQGKYDEAIAMLQEVRPGDPLYDSALAMIGDLQQKKSRAAAVIDGKPAAEYYQENVDAALAAFAVRDFVAAKKAFENALRVKPLPPDAKTSYDTAAQQVAKLATAKQLFAERKYNDAVNSLEPLLRQEPDNPNIKRMITDAHFNLGAMALQEERLQDAVREFDEVLKADPNDELAKRSRELALRYDGEPKDLLYRIYVKYLPMRQPAV
jgi:tetratricopeptide (TPR) repeat protein